MHQSNFNAFCRSVKRAFDGINGAIARCFSKRASADITVCAGVVSNSKLTADTVTVWDNTSDRKLYAGPLNNPELRKLLTLNKVCGAELTSSLQLGTGKQGNLYCFGDFAECRITDCPYKKNHN